MNKEFENIDTPLVADNRLGNKSVSPEAEVKESTSAETLSNEQGTPIYKRIERRLLPAQIALKATGSKKMRDALRLLLYTSLNNKNGIFNDSDFVRYQERFKIKDKRTVHKTIVWMLTRNWIGYYNGVYFIRPLIYIANQLKVNNRRCVKVDDSTLDNFQEFLFSAMIADAVASQNRARHYVFKKNNLKKGVLKKKGSAKQDFLRDVGLNPYFGLSIQTMAERLETSSGTVSRLKKTAKKKKMITVNKQDIDMYHLKGWIHPGLRKKVNRDFGEDACKIRFKRGMLGDEKTLFVYKQGYDELSSSYSLVSNKNYRENNYSLTTTL